MLYFNFLNKDTHNHTPWTQLIAFWLKIRHGICSAIDRLVILKGLSITQSLSFWWNKKDSKGQSSDNKVGPYGHLITETRVAPFDSTLLRRVRVVIAQLHKYTVFVGSRECCHECSRFLYDLHLQSKTFEFFNCVKFLTIFRLSDRLM